LRRWRAQSNGHLPHRLQAEAVRSDLALRSAHVLELVREDEGWLRELHGDRRSARRRPCLHVPERLERVAARRGQADARAIAREEAVQSRSVRNGAVPRRAEIRIELAASPPPVPGRPTPDLDAASRQCARDATEPGIDMA